MGIDANFDRKTAIGASEAVAVVAPEHSPWLTPFKLQQIKLGTAASKPETIYMKLGNLMEPIIGSLLESERGLHLRHANETKRHHLAPNVAASPDFFALDGSYGVETKAIFRTSNEWGDEGTDEVPIRYAIQCRINMAVWNKDKWVLAALVNGDLRVYHIYRDRELEDEMIHKLQSWYERHVVEQEPVEMGAKDLADYVKERFPTSNGTMLESTDEINFLVAEYKEKSDLLVGLDAEVGMLSDRIKNVIADADGIKGPFGQISWKTCKGRKITDWETLAKAKGVTEDEIVAATKESKSYRRWTEKWAKS